MVKVSWCKTCGDWHSFEDWKLTWRKSQHRFFRECRHTWMAWKRKNRVKTRRQSREHKQRLYETNSQKVLELFGDACMQCGRSFPFCAYDLHHTDPTKKDRERFLALANYKWEYLEAEVKKCILVCANCHRILHNEV